MVWLTYNPNILTKMACLGAFVALPRTLMLITQRSLDGGAVLGLMVLFSGESQNKVRTKSGSGEVLWILLWIWKLI
jgi:hypothetical protein